MKLCSFAKAALYGMAASSCGREPEGHDWKPPGPKDSRSPCPGLNNMANHGYLPRDGRDINIDEFRSGIKNAYGYNETTFDFAFNQAVDFKLTTTGNASTFHLDDLKKHDLIEFDGSLSRNDIYFGDNLHFDPVIWATTAERLRLYDLGPSKEDRYVTIEAAAKARAARVKDAKMANPQFNASANALAGSPGTTALYLTTLWDAEAGAVPKAWIRSFFEKERIPYILGYQKTPKNADDFNAIFEQVLAVPVDS